MTQLEKRVGEALHVLLGLKLCLTKNSGCIRGFHFGEILRVGGALMGDFALHVSCPWRIENEQRVITGSGDHFERADDNMDPAWEVGMVWGTFQEQALRALMGGVDVETNACVNRTNLLVVDAIVTDLAGGVQISLSGGYRLKLFPSSARGESWRLLPPGEGPHFVVEGGEALEGSEELCSNDGIPSP